jgi:hypothetical protein|tara:strand:- start:474 stop:719 length:246 start_codon:yes stop_codon:yes gene_type:complete
MQKRKTRVEEFSQEHSYEQITDMETDFLLEIYDAIATIVNEGGKVSLLRLSKIVRVSPRELTDYLTEIVQMERQLNGGEDE